MQMLSHGLMTALFFALIGMIYGRTHTRDIREMGGLDEDHALPWRVLRDCRPRLPRSSGIKRVRGRNDRVRGSVPRDGHLPPGIHDHRLRPS